MRCPKTRIIFKFIQDIDGGNIKNVTDWGFDFTQKTQDVKETRWGRAEVVGKDVKHIKPGDYILIEPMMWTLSFTHENNKYWATAEHKVIAVSEAEPTGLV